MFSGLLFCADCKTRLTFNIKYDKSPIKFFSCPNYKGNRNGTCESTHYIRVDSLEEIVKLELKKITQYLKCNEDSFVYLLEEKTKSDNEKELKQRKQNILNLTKRNEEISLLYKRLYEDNVMGKISDERFMELSNGYDDEQEKNKRELSILIKQDKTCTDKDMLKGKFIKTVKNHTGVKKLTPVLLRELIEKIEVYPIEGSGKNKTQKIAIYYNFIGTFNVPVIKSNPQCITHSVRKGIAVTYKTDATA